MKITKLSPKQKEVFRWCHGNRKDKYDAIICDGAIRSGKTVCMIASYIHWAMRYYDEQTFAICGKTVRSADRNIITPLLNMTDVTAYYKLYYIRSLNLLTVKSADKTNYFYIFGGKDESSASLIQGLTLAGVLLDEVALMPRSFVEQALARCSVEGSKFWFNCNPSNPLHWFYTEWILKADELRAYHLHFNITDNPSLSSAIIERYKRLYTGVFYERFILGKWVAAEGLIYPFFNADDCVKGEVKADEYYISVDYGTQNPCSMGLWGINYKEHTATRIKEYYYSGREKGVQLTDSEYYRELEKLAQGYNIDSVIVDPSAASFIAEIRKHDRFDVRGANNDVVEGIRTTGTYLKNGKIKIHENCKDAIKEFQTYAWDEKSKEDKPIKDNDHAMDDTRYFCYTILKPMEW